MPEGDSGAALVIAAPVLHVARREGQAPCGIV